MPGPPTSAQNDGELRREFIEWLRTALREIVAGRHQDLVVPDLRASIQSLWEAGESRFEGLASAVTDISPRNVERYGVGGQELRSKLEIVAYWWARFLGRGTVEILRRALEAVDTLLESILGALGAGDAIAELKDGIRNALDF